MIIIHKGVQLDGGVLSIGKKCKTRLGSNNFFALPAQKKWPGHLGPQCACCCCWLEIASARGVEFMSTTFSDGEAVPQETNSLFTCWDTQKMLKLARARCLQLCEFSWKIWFWKKSFAENLVLALRRHFWR